MTDRLTAIEAKVTEVLPGRLCADVADTAWLISEVKRLRVIEQAAREWAAVDYGDVGEYEAGAALVEALNPLT